jgi:hypothetical protein
MSAVMTGGGQAVVGRSGSAGARHAPEGDGARRVRAALRRLAGWWLRSWLRHGSAVGVQWR